MKKRFLVTLTAGEREELNALISAGKASAKKLRMPASCSRPIKSRVVRLGGTTKPLPRRSRSASTRSPEFGNGSSSRGWKPPWFSSASEPGTDSRWSRRGETDCGGLPELEIGTGLAS